MKNKTKVLDCTLRDGGYINNWNFPTESTKDIIKSLVKARVDIVECGFVSQSKGQQHDSTQFKDINQVNDLLKSLDCDLSGTKFCIMINKGEYDLDAISPFDSKSAIVSGIRYAFHKKDWQQAINDIKILIEKGYEVYVQPMVTLSYSDVEILQLLEKINKLNIFAVYIVDSFGAMLGDDFKRLHYLFENNLKPNFHLGYHSHNNLQLAYSNAIDFIQIKNSKREIILDSSIHGMGRGAGNLTTELVADYLNKKIDADYNIIPLLETIDKYLEAIYKENYWGYSIAHFLSASFGCHPNYATFLVNTKTLSIVDMQKILSLLDNGERKDYSRTRIEELYINYKSQIGISTNFNSNYFNNKEVLIIAPGPNSKNQKELVQDIIKNKKPIIIAVNHIPENYLVDHYFFSNQKRFDKFKNQLDFKKVIITTNIKLDEELESYKVVNYHDLVMMTKNKNDNVSILLLNLLASQKAKEVFIAGMDGYKHDTENYSYQEFDRIIDKKELEKQNEGIELSLSEIKNKITTSFITDSIYK